MGFPTSKVGYTSATARRGDNESSYEHVVALEKKFQTVVVFNTNLKHIYIRNGYEVRKQQLHICSVLHIVRHVSAAIFRQNKNSACW